MSHASKIVSTLLASVALAACASPARGQCFGGLCFRPAVQQAVQYAPLTVPPVVAWPGPGVVRQPAFVHQPAVPVAPVALTYYPQYPAVIQVGGTYYYAPGQPPAAPFVRYYPPR